MVGGILIMGGLGVFVGVGLALASKIFYVYVDPKIEDVEEALPGAYYVGIKSLKPGINIQAIANLRLGQHWDLRCLPGISFGERPWMDLIARSMVCPWCSRSCCIAEGIVGPAGRDGSVNTR